jgi:large subunit ribosomal protein L31
VKERIHPEYHKVLFVDVATGKEWVSRSTAKSSTTKVVDGEEMPVIRLEISSHSHPFWTGRRREVDADGKIDRFRKRYSRAKKKS